MKSKLAVFLLAILLLRAMMASPVSLAGPVDNQSLDSGDYEYWNVDDEDTSSDVTLLGSNDEDEENSDFYTDVWDYDQIETTFANQNVEERCGLSVNELVPQRRILGGADAGFGSFPWMATIAVPRNNRIYLCGGSLISHFHVITAGHCLPRRLGRYVIEVTLGDYITHPNTEEPLPSEMHYASEIYVHPYNLQVIFRYDVGVLKLHKYVEFKPHISPICLPKKNEEFPEQLATVIGWGSHSTLQMLSLPIVNAETCLALYEDNSYTDVIYDDAMCAGYENGARNVTPGDSGGPLMMMKYNRWYIIGITSFGVPDLPSAFHKISYSLNWILSIVNP